MSFTSHLLPVADLSQVGAARRQVAALGDELGFGETERSHAALVVTELARNLVVHGGGGEIVFRCLKPLGGADGDGGPRGLELLFLDSGPGMRDVARCLTDGHSTAGTPGTGLGAAGRQSDVFEVHSVPGRGTAILSRVWSRQPPPPGSAGVPGGARGAFQVGGVSLPVAGETRCGDAWNAAQVGADLRVIVADGLGHGPRAAEAAEEAVDVFDRNPGAGVAETLEIAHGPLKKTRGAAVSVARVEPGPGLVRFAGAGNVTGVLLAPPTAAGGSARRSLVSRNGTVGLRLSAGPEFTYPWTARSVLILHSDGLQTQWSLDREPGLAARHPALIAGVLFRDHRRGRDDVTVVAARQRPPGVKA